MLDNWGYTHTQLYLTLTGFPRQQWLRECGVCVCVYIYIAYLVLSSLQYFKHSQIFLLPVFILPPLVFCRPGQTHKSSSSSPRYASVIIWLHVGLAAELFLFSSNPPPVSVRFYLSLDTDYSDFPFSVPPSTCCYSTGLGTLRFFSKFFSFNFSLRQINRCYRRLSSDSH
jgi:hypothetical protein